MVQEIGADKEKGTRMGAGTFSLFTFTYYFPKIPCKFNNASEE